MTMEQTVEIPASHRLIIDVPPEVPAGRAKVIIVPGAESDLFRAASRNADVPDTETASGLSQRFAGALRVSRGRYEEMQQTLRQGREDWDRPLQ